MRAYDLILELAIVSGGGDQLAESLFGRLPISEERERRILRTGSPVRDPPHLFPYGAAAGAEAWRIILNPAVKLKRHAPQGGDARLAADGLKQHGFASAEAEPPLPAPESTSVIQRLEWRLMISYAVNAASALRRLNKILGFQTALI